MTKREKFEAALFDYGDSRYRNDDHRATQQFRARVLALYDEAKRRRAGDLARQFNSDVAALKADRDRLAAIVERVKALIVDGCQVDINGAYYFDSRYAMKLDRALSNEEVPL